MLFVTLKAVCLLPSPLPKHQIKQSLYNYNHQLLQKLGVAPRVRGFV